MMRTRSNSDPRPGWQRPQPRHTRNSPPSTAWLEAQAAFSAPAPATPATPTPLTGVRTGPAPVVVVRRSRPLDAEAALANGVAPGSAAEQARPARVFRVVASAPAEAASLAAATQATAPAAVQSAPSSAARRRRARPSQQAPGVATVISFTPPAVPVLPYREQMAQLQQMMVALDETIAAVQWAQGFELSC